MPQAALRPCTYPGCGALSKDGRCDKHPRTRDRDYDRRRGSAAARGYGYRWQQYSENYRRAHPLCCRCKARGVTTPTECVDHIEPVTGPDDPRFWDPDNHQSLCLTCHSEKTATEDGGFGNPRAQ